MEPTYAKISWQDIISDTDTLSNQILKPDVIICISRGGNIPGTLLAYKLNVDTVISFSVQSYGDEFQSKAIKVNQEPGFILDRLDKSAKILVVDDLSDKGKTLEYVKKYLNEKKFNSQFCTLYIKRGTDFTPDYFVRTFEDSEWIVFPWD